MKVRRAFGPPAGAVIGGFHGVRANGQPRNCFFRTSPAHGAKVQAAWGVFCGISSSADCAGSQLQLVLTRRLRRDWPRPSKPSIPARATSVVGCAQDAQPARRRAPARSGLSVKHDAQRIYLARNTAQARRAFARFRFHWQNTYPALVKRLERDLPELLTFFDFPQPLWRKLRTTNAIERCFVEVRRRTRPMVLFTNVQSVERIVYAIFYRFNQQWQNRTLSLFTQAA